MYHFDLHYDLVKMRHDELVQRATAGRGGSAHEPRRRWFGRRGRPAAPPAQPASSPPVRHLVAVPRSSPPAAGDDTRVA